MKKREKGRIPNFKTYEEETHFWDTHDVTDFEDETRDVEIIFDLKKPKEETLILRLQKELKKKLERIAKSKGLSTSSLARMWLIERLQTGRV